MLSWRTAPAKEGDLIVGPGLPCVYDIGMYEQHTFPIQLSERVLSYPEHNPPYNCRWDNDRIIGSLNLTEPA